MSGMPVQRLRVVAGMRLLRRIGSGGEGEVWEARDARGRLRACKLVRPECLAAPAEAARRGRLLTRIDHPALVAVRASGVLQAVHQDVDAALDGWGYVDMDLVEGESLADAAADPRLAQALYPVAEALDLLHEGVWSDGVPVVHRDVKPANLVERSDGTLVLVDPSTLRGVDATELTRVGTPVFSAPEVYTGRIGPPTDVYGFAVTLIALVTGLRGRELADALADADRLALPAIIADALAADPHERPASCRALLPYADEITVLEDWLPSDRTAVDHRRVPPPHMRWHADAPPRGVVAREPARPTISDDEDEELPASRRSLLPWALVLLVCCGVPAVAAVLATGSWDFAARVTPLAVPLLVAATGIGVAAQLGARRPLWLAVVMPPLAWAVLLAERAGGTRRRRAWSRAVLLPGCVAVVAAPALAFSELSGLSVAGQPVATRDLALMVAAIGGGGAIALLLGIAAVRARGLAGFLGRMLALPLWAAGVVALAVLAAVATPLALMLSSDAPLRAVGASLAAVTEVVRRPR